MPFRSGHDKEGSWVAWGHGHHYHYKTGNKESRQHAHERADKQRRAIEWRKHSAAPLNKNFQFKPYKGDLEPSSFSNSLVYLEEYKWPPSDYENSLGKDRFENLSNMEYFLNDSNFYSYRSILFQITSIIYNPTEKDKITIGTVQSLIETSDISIYVHDEEELDHKRIKSLITINILNFFRFYHSSNIIKQRIYRKYFESLISCWLQKYTPDLFL
jgi:hypothetical protein